MVRTHPAALWQSMLSHIRYPFYRAARWCVRRSLTRPDLGKPNFRLSFQGILTAVAVQMSLPPSRSQTLSLNARSWYVLSQP